MSIDSDALAKSLGIATEAPSAEADSDNTARILASFDPPDEDEDDEDNEDNEDPEGGEDDERQRVQAEANKQTERKSGAEAGEQAKAPDEAEITALREKAEKGERLLNLINGNPLNAAQALLSNLDDKTRAQVLRQFGVAGGDAGKPALNPLQQQYQEYQRVQQIADEDLTPAERFLMEQHDTIVGVPEKLEKLVTLFDGELDSLYAMQEFNDAAQSEFYTVIGEALFSKPLPAPDYKAYVAARQAGKDLKTAVAETFGKTIRAAVETKEKPRTPSGNDGGGKRKRPGATASLAELMLYQAETGTKERF